MKNSIKKVNTFHKISILALLMAGFYAAPGHASVSLSKDWRPERGKTPLELELETLHGMRETAAKKLNAVTNPPFGEPQFDPAFRMHLDDTLYYIQGAMFMPKSRPNEVCAVADFKNTPTYHCKEGQTYAYKSHLLFFNANFEQVGTHQFKINEPFEYYVNAMPAMGIYNKERNELLVTVQYFPTDRIAASKVSDVGAGWKRMTILFRVKAVDGKILVEQDDVCLKNPNTIDTIPDARKQLKQCNK